MNWQADDDYLLNDVQVGAAVNVYVSFDPSLTTASTIAPVGVTVGKELVVKQSGNSSSMSVPAGPYGISVGNGQKVYVAASAAGSVLLYFDTVSDTVEIDGKQFARAQ